VYRPFDESSSRETSTEVRGGSTAARERCLEERGDCHVSPRWCAAGLQKKLQRVRAPHRPIAQFSSMNSRIAIASSGASMNIFVGTFHTTDIRV
jgi:hypothetical protein